MRKENRIFKRKSFHLFRNIGDLRISADELAQIKETNKALTPLCPDIKTEIKIEAPDRVNRRRGNEYYILFYSEKKDNYLQNIGYLGEQLDLHLAAINIGALDEMSVNGLDLCLQHNHIKYEIELFFDDGENTEKTLTAVYRMK